MSFQEKYKYHLGRKDGNRDACGCSSVSGFLVFLMVDSFWKLDKISYSSILMIDSGLGSLLYK